MAATFNDIEAIIAGEGDSSTIYLTIPGVPMVQQRARIRWCRLAFQRPRMYDPCSVAKKAYRLAVKNALTDVGVSSFPIFGNDDHLQLIVNFGVSNQGKDLDNLLKFVMDALQGVVYRNDSRIWISKQDKISVAADQQFTTVEVKKIV
jgi:Holliday junction resolvase RusA-like endonuclease